MDEKLIIPVKRKALVESIDPTEQAKLQQQQVNEVEREKMSEYTDISFELPSKGIFYPELKSIRIRPFTIQDVLKLHTSIKTESMVPVAEAVSASLLASEGRSILDYSTGDFSFFLYWLRLNSYFSEPFTAPIVCTDKEHHKKVIAEEMPLDSLITEVTVTISDLQVDFLDNQQEIYDFVLQVQKDFDIDLRPVTVRDDIEFKELTSEIPEEEREHDTTVYMAQKAQFLSSYHGDTLKDKIEFLRNATLPPKVLSLIDEFDKLTQHGVIETISGKCGGCGAEIEQEVSISALSFFPDLHG